MDISYIVGILHLVFFGWMLYRNIKANNWINLSNFTLLIWVVASISSIVFVYSDIRDYHNIGIIPAIFWCLLFYITMKPMLQFSYDPDCGLLMNHSLLRMLCIVFCIASIFPFIELLIQFIPALLSGGGPSGGDLAEAMADLHDDRQEGEQIEVVHFSILSLVCFKLINYSILLPSFVFFASMSELNTLFPNSRTRKYIIAGFIMLFLSLCMNSFLNAQRSMIARNLMTWIGAFVLFYSYYYDTIKKILIRSISIVGMCAVLGLAFITIARFTVAQDRATAVHDRTIAGWVSLYLGEGLLNYNEYVWNMNCPTEGDVTMLYYKKLFGYDRIIDDYHRRNFWTGRTGIPQHIFYTHIGAFVEDFTPIGALLILGIFSFCASNILRQPRGVPISWSKLYFLLILFYIIANGYCYYAFGGLNKGFRLFRELLICLFLALSVNNSRYSNQNYL